MLALSVVDNIGGTATAHFRNPASSLNFKLDDGSYEKFYLLDTDLVTLPHSARSALIQIVREKTTNGILTWIGVYTSMPPWLNAVRPRTGNYCGAGAWFLETRFKADKILPLLRRVLDNLCKRIEATPNPAQWRISDLRLEELGLSDSSFSGTRSYPNDEPISLGYQTICFALTPDMSRYSIEDCIDQIQSDDGYNEYKKIVISDDPHVIGDITQKKRIVVRGFSGQAPTGGRNTKPRPAVGRPVAADSLVDQRLTSRFFPAREHAMSEDLNVRARLYNLDRDIAELRSAWKDLSMVNRPSKLILGWNTLLSFLCLGLLGYTLYGHSIIDDQLRAPGPSAVGGSSTKSVATPTDLGMKTGDGQIATGHTPADGGGKPSEVEACQAGMPDCPLAKPPPSSIDDLTDASSADTSILAAIQQTQMALDKISVTKFTSKGKDSLKNIRNELNGLKSLIADSAQHRK